ncbi:MAG: 2-amino-4-hydroxy-6-hydroxymethyldihydropteridine diphosphokinase [Flavobacteriales bacterium]
MSSLILGLGGNQGNVLDTFQEVEYLISNEIGIILKRSSDYQTEAWGNTHQPDFFNKVIQIETNLSVQDCLKKVLEIEQQLGRVRTKQKWTERVIDIDILFYDDVVINQEELVIPHPYIQDRNFVLFPLVEIYPNFLHPTLNKTVNELLKNCEDLLGIKKILKS